jgi:hypothetical protein
MEMGATTTATTIAPFATKKGFKGCNAHENGPGTHENGPNDLFVSFGPFIYLFQPLFGPAI